jgi:hypothetical protein
MGQEVRVQTSNYAAEHGSSAVQISATTKSGSSNFHGSLYDYIRNHKFQANDRSNSINNVSRPLSKYQYPGGNIGGPVYLPRFGEGAKPYTSLKDKLFSSLATNAITSKLMKALKVSGAYAETEQGDFSELLAIGQK